MTLLRRLGRALANRRKLDRELEEELESFLALLAEEKTKEGMAPREARRLALLELGGKATVRERIRDDRIGEPVRVFLRDLRFGARGLAKSPGFTVIVVFTLALGIGATTAVFSVARGVLLRSLPYPDSDRLVFLWTRWNGERRTFSPPDYVDLRERLDSFESLTALQGGGIVTFSVDGRSEPARMREVTPGVLATYGVEPYLGRALRAEDDRPVDFAAWGDPEASIPEGALIVSYELFENRFGGDPAVLGRSVFVDAEPYRIVGVAPPGFRTLLPDDGDYGTKEDLWIPSRMDFERMPRDVPFLRIVGRLRKGVRLEHAESEASLFAARERDLHRLHREGRFSVEVEPLRRSLSEDHARAIGVLLGAVGLLLLIACANLTNLLLSRAVARQKEIAVRMALGAGRRRLVRQMLTENLGHALLGALAGLGLGRALLALFTRLAPPSLPRVDEIAIDGPVLAFSLALTVVVTMLVSLVPAFRFSRPKSLGALRSAGRGSTELSSNRSDALLVVAEVALSVILVIGTALLLRSLWDLLEVKPGFEAKQVWTAEMSLPSRRYPRYPRPDARVRFARELLEGVEEIPSVEAAGLALVIPLSRQDAGHSYATDAMAGSTSALPPAKYRPVTPGYFEAVGTKLVSGRDFEWSDLEERRLVTIVDEKLASLAWPGEDPLGKRLRIEVWSTRNGPIHLEPFWTVVVGVARNVRSAALDHDDLETVYLPYSLYAVSELSLLVRSRDDPAGLTAPIRERLDAVDADLALFQVRVLEDWVTMSIAPRRFSLLLLAAFGATGLLLALAGIYGVLSSAVSLSRREHAVRMALGAEPRDVLRQVLRRGALLTVTGLLVGAAIASLAARTLSSQLYGVGPSDPGAYASVAILISAVSFAASYLPARRAARIDPMKILRLE